MRPMPAARTWGLAIGTALATLIVVPVAPLHATEPDNATRTSETAAGEPFPARIALRAPDRTPNTLLPTERAEGWRLLFDGKSGAEWRAAEGDAFPEQGWSTEEGTLSIRAARFPELRAGGDLFSRARFGEFVFDFEFWIDEGANGGIKYHATAQREWGYVHALGCEYQLLDDARHPDANRGRDGNRRLAGLYDLFAAEPIPFHGVRTWNHGRIHVEAGHLAHYLNGIRVLQVELDSARWRRALEGSKFADRKGFCANAGGHLVLQDHGDLVRFRNLRIRSLDPNPDDS